MQGPITALLKTYYLLLKNYSELTVFFADNCLLVESMSNNKNNIYLSNKNP